MRHIASALVCLLLALVLGFDECLGSTKQWTQDVNYNNSANWDLGQVPCSQDTVVFKEKTNVVFIQSDGILREVILPNNGEIVLANTMTIAFSDDASIDPQCNGKDETFNADTPKHWFDPDNWEDPQGPVTVETELIPCRYDDVIFPKDKLFSVALNQSVTVGSVNIDQKDYTGTQLTSFLHSSRGKLQFSVKDDVSISVYGYGCPDSTGCPCGNDEPQTKDMICSMMTCYPLTCYGPITPEGACCAKCGAVMTMEFDHALFHMDRFKMKIKTTYGSVSTNKRTTKRQADTSVESEIIFYISKTSTEKIQMVITDRETGSSSGRLAVEMAQRIFRDMRKEMSSFGITKVTSHTSSKGTGGHSGGPGSLSSGGIAGIIITMLIVLAIAGTGVFMYCRRVAFRKDEPLHAEIEMTPSVHHEYVHQLPTDPKVAKGFDNPVYATTPSPTKDGKPLYADPTKADPQVNGQRVNGHQQKGSFEKRPFQHENAANGLEEIEQRDTIITGMAFSNPMSPNIKESNT